MAEPTSASALIRASIDALPQGLREPWANRGEDVRAPIHDGGTSYMHVAIAEDDYDNLGGRAIAAHIALLASPDVATALADLLDAIHPRGHGAGYDCDAACLDPINTAADALEQAITKGGQT